MKIAHIGIHYNPNRGGGNLRNSRILDEFIANFPDNEITLISYKHDSAKFEGNSDSKLNLFFSNSVLIQIFFLIRLYFTKGIDVVHCHNPRVFFAVNLLPIKFRIVLELHSFQSMSKFKEKLFSKFLEKSDRIIVLGKFGVDLLVEKYKISRKKIEIVSNGYIKIDLQTNNERIESTTELMNISYIGSFYNWQGVYNYVDAVEIYIKKYGCEKVKFFMVGSGQEFKNINDLIKEKKLESFINLTGQISPQEVGKYWELTDVFIIPRPSTQATETTVPLKLFDAFAYGKVIIGSNVKGVTELIEHGSNGLVYPHDNVQDLSDCMNTVVTDCHLFNRLSENARKSCDNLPTWAEVADKLNKIYQNQLN